MENTRTWSFPFHSCVVGGPPSIHFFLGRNRKSLKHGFSTFLSAVVLGGYGEFGFSFSNVWLPSSWEGQRKRASQGQGKDRSDVGVPSSQGGDSRVFSNTTVQKHKFFGAQLSSQSNSHIHTWPLEKQWLCQFKWPKFYTNARKQAWSRLALEFFKARAVMFTVCKWPEGLPSLFHEKWKGLYMLSERIIFIFCYWFHCILMYQRHRFN